jgi:hypothetical protein
MWANYKYKKPYFVAIMTCLLRVGSGINQEKLAGEMVGMGRTWSHIWFGKMIYRPERSRVPCGNAATMSGHISTRFYASD